LELSETDRRAFLKDEYLLLQNQYEDFDRRSLTIKGWVASGAAAALAISFSTNYRLSVLIPVFVTVIALVFWYLEAKWKLFQYALADRIRVIEAYFRDDTNKPEANPAPFQVYHYWYKSYAKDEPIFEYERTYRPKSLSARAPSVCQRAVCRGYRLERHLVCSPSHLSSQTLGDRRGLPFPDGGRSWSGCRTRTTNRPSTPTANPACVYAFDVAKLTALLEPPTTLRIDEFGGPDAA
jgi:hypothetical protein